MKKTHKWLGVALCAMAFGGSAQAQKLMVVEMQDSADNWSCALSKISAATFLNGQISFGADEGETTTTLKAIDLKGIEKITFVDDPTAVKSVVASPAAKLRAVVMGNTLRVLVLWPMPMSRVMHSLLARKVLSRSSTSSSLPCLVTKTLAKW